MKDVIPDRDLRQRALVPPERLAECRASVIGVGAIGRQVALQLAAMGVPRLQLVDHDVVEPANLACQGYLQDELGRPKVQASADLCHRINPMLDLQSLAQRFRRSMEIGNVLFCCVDSIETRRLIWEAVKDRVEFFADGRMSAETIRVLAACDSRGRQHYPSTLFAAAEAHPEPCTAKSTIYTANVAAGLMLGQFTKWMRRLPVEPDITLNLLTCELTVLAGS